MKHSLFDGIIHFKPHPIPRLPPKQVCAARVKRTTFTSSYIRSSKGPVTNSGLLGS